MLAGAAKRGSNPNRLSSLSQFCLTDVIAGCDRTLHLLELFAF